MPKTPTEYLTSDPTENQAHFLQWVLAETGLTFRSAKESEAFATGVRAAGLYSRYQASKRPVSAAPAEKMA